MNARDTFSELRARLQQRPDRRLRAEVFGLLDVFWETATDDELARFDDAHFDYVSQSVERRWPEELRVWTLGEDGEGSLPLARTLRIAYPTSPDHPRNDALRVAPVLELTPNDVAHLDGLQLIGLGRTHDLTVEHLIGVLGPLTRLEVYTHGHTADLFDALLTCHATTVTRLGVAHLPRYTGQDVEDARVDRVCDALLGRLRDIEGIKDLTLHHTAGREPEARAWLPELLAHPAMRALDTLSVGAHAAPFDPSWVTEWEGVGELKRLHVCGLGERHREALATAPELRGVERWNLSSGHEDVWIDDETDAWTELVTSGSEVVDARDLQLTTMSGRWLERLLLDERSELRERASLETLALTWPTSDILDALLIEGPEALPQLEHLHIETRHWESPERYLEVGESGLCDQLDTFEWTMLDVPSPFDTPDDKRADIARWCAVVTSPKLHPRIRRRVMDKLLRGCGTTLTNLRHVARELGVKGRSKMSVEELRAAFEAMIPVDEEDA